MSKETIETLEPKLKDRLTNPDYEWNRLDDRHDAIFEASAGTGKTYALESIVMKLVLEKDVNIRNILLVTYTEKAAGELKDRVRAALSAAGHLPDDFDEATICTIHSFCRELLSKYAFENRVPMKTDIAASDAALIHQAVRTTLTGEAFRQRYGTSFAWLMEAAGLDSTEDLAITVEAAVKAAAASGAAICEPSATDELFEALRTAWSRLTGDGHGVMEVLHGKGVSADVINGADAKSFMPDVAFLDARVAGLDWSDQAAVANVVRELHSRITGGSNRFNPRLKKPLKGRLWDEALPQLGDVIEKAETAHAGLAGQLVNWLGHVAGEEYGRLKKMSSSMTFDDMVAEASKVIAAQAEDSELLKLIRRQYRIALVDEFQDTDPKQWNIFKRIFSSNVNTIEEGPGPRQGFLLVVGDPKQAIYSFRGADIGTYLTAREEITGGKAESPYKRTLGATYRSTPQMVQAFNAFFSIPEWFGDMKVSVAAGADGQTRELPLDYSPVSYPVGVDEFAPYVEQPELCPPIKLLESVPTWVNVNKQGGFGSSGACLPTFMDNAARTIRQLMDAPSFPIYDKKTKMVRRRLQLGDFCVLVRTGDDAAVVKRALSKANIPYGHYKEGGVFATAEAESVLALLDFLANPGGRGNLSALLLTPFFRVRPCNLSARLATEDPTCNRLFDKWQELASQRRWNVLFESAMNDTQLAHPLRGDYEYDRRWAAVRQIFDRLLAAIGRSARTADEFADLLRSWCKDDSGAGDNGALRQRESDANRVQIMTMHASKGLEFPVVFLAYGFSSLGRKGASEDEKTAERQEARRLVYVAITRAKYCVYLPWTKREEGRDGVGSSGSALRKGFLAKGIQAYFGGAENAQANVVEPPSVEGASQTEVVEPGAKEPDVPPCTVYDIGYLGHLRLQWDSYSSLGHHSAEAKMTSANARETDENHAGANGGGRRAETLLPRNNVSGDVFHEIMETLCGHDDTDKRPGFKSIGGVARTDVEAQRRYAL